MRILPMAVVSVATLLTGCSENALSPERAGAELSSATADNVAAKRLEGSDHGGRPLATTLDGASEVPGPGDPDGSGTAIITLNYGQGEVCWELTAADIETATAAHIHSGNATVAGPVVVPLTPPASGSSSGCATDVDRELIKAILQTPSDYYVNVHNAVYPAGAVRGQLSK